MAMKQIKKLDIRELNEDIKVDSPRLYHRTSLTSRYAKDTSR